MKKHIGILQTSHKKSNNEFTDFINKHSPDVKLTYLSDSSLLSDLGETGGPTDVITGRMIMYALAFEKMGCDIILNTCSSVGDVFDICAECVKIPIFKIDQPMAKEAAGIGTKVALIATVPTTLPPSRRLIEKNGTAMGKEMQVTEHLVEGAYHALCSGDVAGHNRMVLDVIRGYENKVDAVAMAQVSMRALLPELQEMKTPVLCSFETGLLGLCEIVNSL